MKKTRTIIAALLILSIQSCKDDAVPNNKATNCKITSIVSSSSSLEFRYEGDRMIEFVDDGIHVNYKYTDNRMTSLIWSSSATSDTTYQFYDDQGRIESRLPYLGKLNSDDSTSFHWNSDGSLKSIQGHRVGGTNFDGWLMWQISLSYSNGDVTALRYVHEEDYIKGLDTLSDDYRKIEYELSDKLNPFYGWYVYEPKLDDWLTFFQSYGFTKHSFHKAHFYKQGNLERTIMFTYKYNADQLMTQITGGESGGSQFSSNINYQCD